MEFLGLRTWLTMLLGVVLAMPASAWHVCRCSRGEKLQAQSAPALKSCCAKRLAAQKAVAAKSNEQQFESRCCCSDLRWNQSITQAPPTRGVEANFLAHTLATVNSPKIVTPALFSHAGFTEPSRDDDFETPLRLLNCRWQV